MRGEGGGRKCGGDVIGERGCGHVLMVLCKELIQLKFVFCFCSVLVSCLHY